MRNIKHGDKLLLQISSELSPFSKTPVGCLQVTLQDRAGRNCFVFSLQTALEAIALDLYFDKTGDWSEADTATVEAI